MTYHTSEELAQHLKLNLKDKVFIGRYSERKLIDCIAAYKDVIEVDNTDADFYDILKKTMEKLKRTDHFWFPGILEYENGYQIVTDLSNCAFGSFWFMIKGITVQNRLIHLNVKCLRPYVEETVPGIWDFIYSKNFDWSAILENISHGFFAVTTRENISYFFRFLGALLIASAVGVYKLLELTLSFIKEANNILKTLTPIILAIIDSITKCFGGILIMLTMMWNGKQKSVYDKNRMRQGVGYPEYQPNTGYKRWKPLCDDIEINGEKYNCTLKLRVGTIEQ